MSSTAVEARKDIRTLIQSDTVKQQMAMVLPKHLSADRMARVACTAILKTPKLTQCKPESLLQALMLCSQAGLEPDGRNAHLIPYGDQVQVIFDWKGLVSLARRNGIENIAAEIVCDNDTFEWYRDADGLHFKHLVDWRKPRGEMFAAYCIWKDSNQFDGEVMTRDEVEGIRKRSRAGNSGPWVTDFNEMAKKTAIRRASKKWPLESEIAEALNNDSDSIPAVDTSAPVIQLSKQIAAPAEPAASAATEPEPLSKTDEGEVRPDATEPEAQQEPSRARLLAKFFKDECGADYSQVVKTLVRLNSPKNADTFASFEDFPEKELMKVWSARRGIATEVKRDIAA